MPNYSNRSGRSNVASYEILNDGIIVVFKDGCRYLYNYASAGEYNINRMKELAAAGSGLNSFIYHNVKKKYAKKY